MTPLVINPNGTLRRVTIAEAGRLLGIDFLRPNLLPERTAEEKREDRRQKNRARSAMLRRSA